WSTPDPERPKVLLAGQSCGPQNLGELPSPNAPQKIHLPQPILSHDVALGLRHIFKRKGTNMGHSPAISLHGDLGVESGKGSASIDLRQWPVDKPPHHGARGHDDDGKNPVQDSKTGSQGGSRSSSGKTSV